jgi:hypothetical protein
MRQPAESTQKSAPFILQSDNLMAVRPQHH